MQVKNAVALVTGSNRGLGRAIRDALLAKGASRVYAGCRDPAQLKVDDGRMTPLRLDVTKPLEVLEAARVCQDVNLLVNNAGVLDAHALSSAEAIAALEHEINVNVLGMLRTTQAFLPVLEKNQGAIVNILSVAAWRAYPMFVTYSASKHAAHAVTEGLRIQLRGRGVRVYGVYAGFIDTDMAANQTGAKASPAAVADEIIQGLVDDRDWILADQRSKDVWRELRSDPQAVQRRLQDIWDKSQRS